MLAKRAFTCLIAGIAWISSVHAQQPGHDPAGKQPLWTIADRPAGLSELLTRARRALAAGQPERAHSLLAPQVRWYAGSPEFDYLLGISALDAGHPGDAILALERVLAVEPGHLQARAEIARAYLAVNETESARRQFEAVAASPIPPEVRRTIDSYLERISRTRYATGTQVSGGIEIGTGWDSNVSLGSRSSQWLLDGGISVTPVGTSRPVSSAVFLAAAGASAVVPMSGGWELTAGGLLSGRWNPSAHTLDTGSVDLAGGLNYRNDCHRFSMLAQYQHLRVDDRAFRDAAGVVAQWRCDIDPRTQAGAYVQYFDLRFPEQGVRDARRSLVGVTLARVLSLPANPLLIATAYGGDEVPKQDIPQLQHRIYGARAALSFGLPQGWKGSASLSWEHRHYDGEEPLFGTVRVDRQTDISVAAERPIAPRWTVRPEIIYTRNDSTLPPNDFNRVQALITTRYAF